jgi:Tfp pilus assembly protein PilF
MFRVWTACATAALLSACSSQPLRELAALFESSRGEYAYRAGLRHYEDGRYGRAADYLQDGIDQGLTWYEQASAHKHLAFIHCASGREQLCRSEFRKALAVDRTLELTRAEAGHPVWGAAFRALKKESPLVAGLRQYEDGEYAASSKSLEGALEGGLTGKDRVTAHKHLAFIHCASKREELCREEFRKALAVDPQLDLAPAEAGHPIWGPIFRAVKGGR